jgi:hypothetical protein
VKARVGACRAVLVSEAARIRVASPICQVNAVVAAEADASWAAIVTR